MSQEREPIIKKTLDAGTKTVPFKDGTKLQTGLCDAEKTLLNDSKKMDQEKPIDFVSVETPPSVQRAFKRTRYVATYSQTVNPALRVAIAGQDFPSTRLSAEFCDDLQEVLGCAIDALPEGSLPRFDEYRLVEQGVIMVTCVDEPSRKWLASTVEEMSPVKGTSLQILESEAIPRLRKVLAFVPGAPANKDNILRRIERSTPELQTGHWSIRNMTVSKKGTRITFGVDEASVQMIQRLNYIAYAGMSRVKFKKPRHSKSNSGANEPTGASSSEETEAQEPSDLPSVKITQINLQHCIVGTSIISQQLTVGHTDIVLIQEPWVTSSIKGLSGNQGQIFVSSDDQIPGPLFI